MNTSQFTELAGTVKDAVFYVIHDGRLRPARFAGMYPTSGDIEIQLKFDNDPENTHAFRVDHVYTDIHEAARDLRAQLNKEHADRLRDIERIESTGRLSWKEEADGSRGN